MNVDIESAVIEAAKLKEFYSIQCLKGFQTLENHFKVCLYCYFTACSFCKEKNNPLFEYLIKEIDIII